MNLSLCQKILDAEQIRETDRYTIAHEPIASIDLMERASEAFTKQFVELYDASHRLVVFCGTGNNGGDGLAVSRLLLAKGYEVSTYIVGDDKNGTADYRINYDILRSTHKIGYIKSAKDFPSLNEDSVIIDAISGSGLSRGLDGMIGELIDHINESQCQVVALDIASGLSCNGQFETEKVLSVVRTVSLQMPKLSMLMPANDIYVGELHIVDIGLNADFMQSQDTTHYFVTNEFVRSMLRSRRKFHHKGAAGHNLIIAGSQGKLGAAMLCGRACLRSGAGLLTMYLPLGGSGAMQVALPEAMVLESKNNKSIQDLPDLHGYDAIGVGPGIGTSKETAKMFEALLTEGSVPMVLDADGLNILAASPRLLKKIPVGSVLTPHPGEFRRLVGEWKDDYHRLDLQQKLAKRTNAVVLLKGAHTSIVTPDGKVFFNSSGNPGMATAGSGDVLTGIITGLLGQGYDHTEAAVMGAYLHGLAGDLHVEAGSQESLIASDIIGHLPDAFRQLSQS